MTITETEKSTLYSFVIGTVIFILAILVISHKFPQLPSGNTVCKEHGYDYSVQYDIVKEETFVECCTSEIGDDSCGHWVPLK